jgi:hypothetical protein
MTPPQVMSLPSSLGCLDGRSSGDDATQGREVLLRGKERERVAAVLAMEEATWAVFFVVDAGCSGGRKACGGCAGTRLHASGSRCWARSPGRARRRRWATEESGWAGWEHWVLSSHFLFLSPSFT